MHNAQYMYMYIPYCPYNTVHNECNNITTHNTSKLLVQAQTCTNSNPTTHTGSYFQSDVQSLDHTVRNRYTACYSKTGITGVTGMTGTSITGVTDRTGGAHSLKSGNNIFIG